MLVTGGSGSFGQAFIKHALQHDVHAVRVFSRNEYLQWQMKQERVFQDSRLRWMIGDVRDKDRLQACMRGVDAVVHAAALKHVGAGQYNPQEFVKTNVLGSVNVLDVSAQCGVRKVLGISSDKAVSPSCLYGATKQIMETLFLEANRWSSPWTLFSCLRSGNFRESHGNIFEVWEQQAASGEISVTLSTMSRFFIPTDAVAKITWDLLEVMEGNEIFVPKMEELSIIKMAEELYPDCRITYTGKGEGEKARELLFTEDEKPVDCGSYWRIRRTE